MKWQPLADRALRSGLERLHRSRPALVPEYPLDLHARWGWDGEPMLAAIDARLAADSAQYEQTIHDACDLLEWARGIPRNTSEPGQPCWENDWWGTVDALVQVAALRRRNPATYVEIGSGFSTLFARRAISDFGLRTRIISIDPAPRHDVDGCCDEVVRRPLEQASGYVLERLAPGDVLLVDGSHVALMNTDATVFFMEILPRLPEGVLVGIDDIFLPWDYPPTWPGRMYGEQYLLAAFLLGGAQQFAVRFPGWWVLECSSLACRFDPLWPVVENRFGRRCTSFWLERLSSR
jgi:methyltransferase family protein